MGKFPILRLRISSPLYLARGSNTDPFSQNSNFGFEIRDRYWALKLGCGGIGILPPNHKMVVKAKPLFSPIPLTIPPIGSSNVGAFAPHIECADWGTSPTLSFLSPVSLTVSTRLG